MIETLHICTAIDGNYKLPLRCLVNSIYQNSTSHKCVLHVLFTDLSKRYRNKLIKKYAGTNLSFDFIDMSKYEFDFHGIDMQYWSNAIFYRIMIPEIFKDLERILYIDGDTLVIQDLFDFFNMKMDDDKYLAMVLDKFSWVRRMQKLNTNYYFNSGVILFDLNKCRNNNFSEKCIKWLHDNPDIAIFPDQDAINIVCNGKIMITDSLYNKMIEPRHYIVFNNKPYIAHFLSKIKPWMWGYPSKFDNLYISYMPTKFLRIKTKIMHIFNIFNIMNFIFHVNHVMPLVKHKVLNQYKYYIFNICVYTKTVGEQDFVTIFNKSKQQDTDVH